MGRRKIEIKAIKDDRNRSVTFLKRKGGLFKKAHELSVLCSVDVAVFIFGSNKKLYEYSSCDMRELITKYTYHGGPNEHKGPSDFNGGADDDDDDDENGTPPHLDGLDGPILPGHFQGPPPFGHIRHQTPSQSPPVSTSVFSQHSGRGQTPQPQINSRPSSRNDGRRMQSVGPQGPPQPNSFAFMPQPAIYNPQNPPSLPPNMPTHGLPQQQHSQYPYGSPQPHPHQLQPFLDDQRRSSLPSTFSAQPQGPPAPRHSTSPPQPQARQLPSQPIPHMSPSPPQHHAHSMQSPPQPRMSVAPSPREQQLQHPQHSQHQPSQEPQPPAPVEPKTKPEPVDKPRQSLLLDTSIKKQPQRKQGSIFTPIDENRSILSQHLAAFHPDVKSDRSQSIDTGSAISRTSHTGSPPGPHRSNSYGFSNIKRNGSMSSIPETVFTPPSRSNSLHAGGGGARPRLKVQIPEESSDAGSATAESSSPRGTATTDATSQPSRRLDCHSGVVLPPPSPSASALLSAGASGPPNPFARPHPHQNNNNMNIDTPVSALPSRFLNNEYLPSPSSFYPDWNFRGNDSNTLPSPLNFATPVVGTGPSFLRDDPGLHKRKSPEINGNGSGHDHMDIGGDAKRVKVDS